jgi:catechol 2,3-dioxygenase-like lactoylglutathione lyase family enzyme
MLNDCDIIAFVTTTDPERATRFYRDVLGLRLVADEAHALVFDAHGTMLRIAKGRELFPAKHTVLGWRVPDIRAAVAGLGGRGVVFERYGFLAQDDLGIWAAPGGAKVAWFQDPDGNVLSITEWKRD